MKKKDPMLADAFEIKMNVDGENSTGRVLLGDANISVEVPLEGHHVMVVMKKDYFFQQLVNTNRKRKARFLGKS